MSNEKHECFECGRIRPGNMMYQVDTYDTPFDKLPQTVWVCKCKPSLGKGYGRVYAEDCLELMTDHSWGDFRYFDCPVCGRFICEQNPRNGWHVQYREYPYESGEQICLRCYEETILEDGHEREVFEAGQIPGMFFSHGNPEPIEAGYEIVEDFDHYHVGNPQPVLDKAIELINTGHKVVIGYESMAIGGLEGYITMFSKEKVGAN
jgi:hypothetical protein